MPAYNGLALLVTLAAISVASLLSYMAGRYSR